MPNDILLHINLFNSDDCIRAQNCMFQGKQLCAHARATYLFPPECRHI